MWLILTIAIQLTKCRASIRSWPLTFLHLTYRWLFRTIRSREFVSVRTIFKSIFLLFQIMSRLIHLSHRKLICMLHCALCIRACLRTVPLIIERFYLQVWFESFQLLFLNRICIYLRLLWNTDIHRNTPSILYRELLHVLFHLDDCANADDHWTRLPLSIDLNCVRELASSRLDGKLLLAW